MDFDVLDVSEAVVKQPEDPLKERGLAKVFRTLRLVAFLTTGTIWKSNQIGSLL